VEHVSAHVRAVPDPEDCSVHQLYLGRFWMALC
jgi:hypothetical protein